MHFWKSIRITIMSALMSAAVSSAQPAAVPETEADPAAAAGAQAAQEAAARNAQAIDQLLSREAEAQPVERLASDDGKFETRVAAGVAAKPELVDGNYFFQLDIGTGAPIECWLYPEGHDLAATHQSLSETIAELTEKSVGKIELKAITGISAGAYGPHPYLGLEWVYRVQAEAGTQIGQLKMLAAIHGESSVHCSHNESGFPKTFEKVVRGLVENLKVAGAAPAPYYREISVMRLGPDLDIGVSQLTLTLDAEGSSKIVERLSFVVPADRQTMATEDSYNVQYSTPTGWLINEAEVELANGEVACQVQLDPAEDGGWKATGTLSGQAVSSTLAARQIPSTLGQMFVLQRFLPAAQAEDRVTFPEWLGSDDPNVFTEVTFDVAGRSGDEVSGKLDLGERLMDAVYDTTGSMKSARIAVGEVALQIERIFVEGELPKPPAPPEPAAAGSAAPGR